MTETDNLRLVKIYWNGWGFEKRYEDPAESLISHIFLTQVEAYYTEPATYWDWLHWVLMGSRYYRLEVECERLKKENAHFQKRVEALESIAMDLIKQEEERRKVNDVLSDFDPDDYPLA